MPKPYPRFLRPNTPGDDPSLHPYVMRVRVAAPTPSRAAEMVTRRGVRVVAVHSEADNRVIVDRARFERTIEYAAAMREQEHIRCTAYKYFGEDNRALEYRETSTKAAIRALNADKSLQPGDLDPLP